MAVPIELINLLTRRTASRTLARRRFPLDPTELQTAAARRAMILMYHGVRPARRLEPFREIDSVVVNSSWVSSIHLVEVGGIQEVMITFLDGARCHYPGSTKADYLRIRRAPSKGKEVWRTFYRRPYILR